MFSQGTTNILLLLLSKDEKPPVVKKKKKKERKKRKPAARVRQQKLKFSISVKLFQLRENENKTAKEERTA